jgi:hypothetical protein
VKEKQKMAFSKKPDKPRKDEAHTFNSLSAGDEDDSSRSAQQVQRRVEGREGITLIFLGSNTSRTNQV